LVVQQEKNYYFYCCCCCFVVVVVIVVVVVAVPAVLVDRLHAKFNLFFKTFFPGSGVYCNQIGTAIYNSQ